MTWSKLCLYLQGKGKWRNYVKNAKNSFLLVYVRIRGRFLSGHVHLSCAWISRTLNTHPIKRMQLMYQVLCCLSICLTIVIVVLALTDLQEGTMSGPNAATEHRRSVVNWREMGSASRAPAVHIRNCNFSFLWTLINFVVGDSLGRTA